MNPCLIIGEISNYQRIAYKWAHATITRPTISPGPLGFILEKDVEIWHFQEHFLNSHFTPWCIVQKSQWRVFFLFKMATIATGWLLL